MNSGPSATFGIMFSVTNSGSNNRLTSGDQVNMTASMTPTRAPRQKPPRISAAVTARLESQAYLAEESVATVASGEGRMNFGTAKASTSTCQSTITARCTIRMIAKDRAGRPPSLNKACSLAGCGRFQAPHGGNLSRLPRSFNQLVDYGRNDCITRSTTCLRRARLAVGLDRSLPKIADRVGVFEKKK